MNPPLLESVTVPCQVPVDESNVEDDAPPMTTSSSGPKEISDCDVGLQRESPGQMVPFGVERNGFERTKGLD